MISIGTYWGWKFQQQVVLWGGGVNVDPDSLLSPQVCTRISQSQTQIVVGVEGWGTEAGHLNTRTLVFIL